MGTTEAVMGGGTIRGRGVGAWPGEGAAKVSELRRDVTRVRWVGAEGRLSPPASSPESLGAVPPRTQEEDLLLSTQTLGPAEST